jgi:regulator of ribonuclease activity B
MTKSEADRWLIEQLRAAGADLNQPRGVIHFLYLPTEQTSHKAAEALRAEGYSIEERLSASAVTNHTNPYVIVATNQTVVNLWVVQQFRQCFEQLAALHAGEYDGWEAAQP